jgi:putative transposase
VLRSEFAEQVRTIVREAGQKAGVDILQGPISLDHVHVMISIPSPVTLSRLSQPMKDRNSSRLFAAFP